MVKQIEMENILAQGDLNQAIDSNTRDINGTKAAIQQVDFFYIRNLNPSQKKLLKNKKLFRIHSN